MPQIVSLLTADGGDYVTRTVSELRLKFEGIENDRHAGFLRTADARTPWHRRGTPIANTRQLSIVSIEECAEMAELLGLNDVDPALLGANVVVSGLPQLSLLTPASRLLFPSGAAIFITEQNAPCRHPAEKLARVYNTPRIATEFVNAAIGRRGLVGIVEREGMIAVDDPIRYLASPARVLTPKVSVRSVDQLVLRTQDRRDGHARQAGPASARRR